jgi:hypothetical protein
VLIVDESLSQRVARLIADAGQAELLLAALDAVEGDLDAGAVVVFSRGRAGVPGCSRAPSDGVVEIAPEWHIHAMARTRVSTTVDDGLLAEAREVTAATSDAALLDQALAALLAQHRRAEVDLAYAVYDERPLDEPDEWGDLASFRAAAGSS